MDPYSIIDAPLDRRAATEGWTVFKTWADAPARFFYIGGQAPFDCFQVEIVPPVEDTVTIIARSVDTSDEDEFEQTWKGKITVFDTLLTAAVAQVEIWKGRGA